MLIEQFENQYNDINRTICINKYLIF